MERLSLFHQIKMSQCTFRMDRIESSAIICTGIIESPTIQILQNELQNLRKDFEELKAMIEYHPDNHKQMEKHKTHFESLVAQQKIRN